jgi:hypothetical protein
MTFNQIQSDCPWQIIDKEWTDHNQFGEVKKCSPLLPMVRTHRRKCNWRNCPLYHLEKITGGKK